MDFSEVKRLMDESVAQHGVPCSDIAIVYKGKIVYRYMNGTSDVFYFFSYQTNYLYGCFAAGGSREIEFGGQGI